MLRIALLLAVGTVIAFVSTEGNAQTYEEFLVERQQIINRTNRQMRNAAIVSQSMQNSLNQLQNHFQQRSGWNTQGNYYYGNGSYQPQGTTYYYSNRPNTMQYNNQRNTVYWQSNNSWGQPQVVYRRW